MSPLESLLLGSRLEQIKNGIVQKYNNEIAMKNDIDTFIFPGAGGIDELVIELQSVTPNSKIIDWKDYRGSVLTAAFDAEAVGEAVANMVKNNRKRLHYIGISVGGFCANAAATTTYLEDSSIDVQLTLLDPFCGRGVLEPNYGREYFGKYATTALHILNTDDPVPTTNDPLPNCCCIDVTSALERENFIPPPGDTMHSWPLAYFARHYQGLPEELKRGSVYAIR